MFVCECGKLLEVPSVDVPSGTRIQAMSLPNEAKARLDGLVVECAGFRGCGRAQRVVVETIVALVSE